MSATIKAGLIGLALSTLLATIAAAEPYHRHYYHHHYYRHYHHRHG